MARPMVRYGWGLQFWFQGRLAVTTKVGMYPDRPMKASPTNDRGPKMRVCPRVSARELRLVGRLEKAQCRRTLDPVDQRHFPTLLTCTSATCRSTPSASIPFVSETDSWGADNEHPSVCLAVCLSTCLNVCLSFCLPA